MTKLLEIWGWIKLNAVILAVATAICAGATAFAYFKGRDHGEDACSGRYERQISAQKDDVIQRLEAIRAEQAAQRVLWEVENAQTNTEIETKTVYIDRVVEKIVEKPVTVTGPCLIDYDGVARVFDAASDPSTFGH